MIVFDIKDSLTQSFTGHLFQSSNIEVAKRSLRLALLEKHSLTPTMISSPCDFDLFIIGDYDMETGVFSPKVQHVCSLKECENGQDISL